MSSKYLEYQQSGYIDKLRKIYFPPSKSCVSIADTEEVELTVENAAGSLYRYTVKFKVCLQLAVLIFCRLALQQQK